MRCHMSMNRNGHAYMRPCHAEKRACPVGGDEVHRDFADYESAEIWNRCAQEARGGVSLRSLQEKAELGHKITEDDYQNLAEKAYEFRAMGYSPEDPDHGKQRMNEEYRKFMSENGAPRELETIMDSENGLGSVDNMKKVWGRFNTTAPVEEDEEDDRTQLKREIVQWASSADFYESGSHYVEQHGLTGDDASMIADDIDHANLVYKKIIMDASKSDDHYIKDSLKSARINADDYKKALRLEHLTSSHNQIPSDHQSERPSSFIDSNWNREKVNGVRVLRSHMDLSKPSSYYPDMDQRGWREDSDKPGEFITSNGNRVRYDDRTGQWKRFISEFQVRGSKAGE